MKFLSKLIIAILLTILISLFYSVSMPVNAKVSPVVFNQLENDQNVIIGFNKGYSHRNIPINVEVKRDFGLINAISTRMSFSAINALKSHPAIDYIEIDHSYNITAPPFNIVTEKASWGLSRIFKDQTLPYPVWSDSLGESVNVAVFDTGIDGAHNDLNVSGGINTINDNPYNTDLNGHGTHVAGIISGLHNDIGILGVAPNINLYSVVVFDEAGNGSTSNLISGIVWSIENNIKVINMSLGSDESSIALENAINEVYNLGVVFIASSGNSGEEGGIDNMQYPAKYENVISVGSTNSDDTLAV